MDDDVTPGRHARRSRRRLVRALALLSVLAALVAVRALADGDPGPLAHAFLLVAMLLAAQALWFEQQLEAPAREPVAPDRLSAGPDEG
ncbi:hypothetical protein [Georgenia daeguensis]|uniref:Uncharacterized protein n=1 Tax=Georgenia daeguensis TaxID=908355 RepID=A0ABP8EPZ2_9MICO